MSHDALALAQVTPTSKPKAKAVPLSMGRIALVEAMNRAEHSVADAARETNSKVGTITNVLSGARNVGVLLGMRLHRRYGVTTEMFRIAAPAGARMPELKKRGKASPAARPSPGVA